MSKFRLAVCTGFAASALLLIPAGSASAHVHGITPLECTAAIDNSPETIGGNQAVGEAAAPAELSGVIPEVKSEQDLTGGSVPPVLQC
jgi:hypothetical protein